MKVIPIPPHGSSKQFRGDSPPAKPRSARRRRAFSLIELLVVIAIIAVLAVLIVSVTGKVRLNAAKVRGIHQMRTIGAGVFAWAAENNNGEPMYFRDGNGDSSSEATPSLTNTNICAGNPAILLYKKTKPAASYITNHTVFFSPIHQYTVPSMQDYDPTKASSTNLWGTFMWVYPSVPAEERTGRQLSAMRSSSYTAVGSEAYNKVLMFDDYSTAKSTSSPTIYLALFTDGSVRQVAPNGDIWGWFQGKYEKTGK